jgi:hypothetical protein
MGEIIDLLCFSEHQEIKKNWSTNKNRVIDPLPIITLPITLPTILFRYDNVCLNFFVKFRAVGISKRSVYVSLIIIFFVFRC